jgi:hypothetical protein
MRPFGNVDRSDRQKDLASLLLGVIGGLAAGFLLSRTLPRSLFSRKQNPHTALVTSRIRPARLYRATADEPELAGLEEAVFNVFMADAIFRERGIDIGVVGPGIVEVSGSVWTESEATRAVSLANRMPGVLTVVNRLDVEQRARRAAFRRPLTRAESSSTISHFEGRVGGMGRRRQGSANEPLQHDESRSLRERSLAAADRTQWSDEGLVGDVSKVDPRTEARRANPTRFPEDQLDNQDPRSKRSGDTPGIIPEATDNRSRLAEGAPRGTDPRLAPSDRPEGLGSEEAPRDR